MWKHRLGRVVSLAVLFGVSAILFAADGDSLKSEFYDGEYSTEKSSVESLGTRANNKWTLTYTYNNKYRRFNGQYGSVIFDWKGGAFRWKDSVGPSPDYQTYSRKTNKSIKEIETTLTRGSSQYSQSAWVPDPGVAYLGQIGDELVAFLGSASNPEV